MLPLLAALQRKEEKLHTLLEQLNSVSRSDEAGKITEDMLRIVTDLESVYILDRDYAQLDELYGMISKRLRMLPNKFDDNRINKRLESILQHSNNKQSNWSTIRRKQEQAQQTLEMGMRTADTGNYQEAIRLFDEAVKQGDEIKDRNQVIEALYDKASIFVDKGSFKDAMQIYRSLAKMDSSGKAWFHMGYIHGQLKQPRKSLLYYQKYLDINPWEPVTLGNIGLTYELLSDFQKALMYYDMSLEIDPANTDVLRNKGKLLRKMGNDKEAMSCFNAALRIDPMDIDALTNKIILLDVYKDKRVNMEGKKAIKICDTIIEKNPKDADTFVRKGIILDILLRRNEAFKSYDEALRIDPGNDFALYNKACTANLEKRKDEAIELLKRAFDINPNYKALAKHDKDLNDLQDDKRFIALVN